MRCSGHGVCRLLADQSRLGLGALRVGGFAGLVSIMGMSHAVEDYGLWDAHSFAACVCDPGFRGHDCSQRTCPHGVDPLGASSRLCGDAECLAEVQRFTVSAGTESLLRISVPHWSGARVDSLVTLRTDAATGLDSADNAERIRRALASTAAEIAFPGLAVTGSGGAGQAQTFSLTFHGTPGNLDALHVDVVRGPIALAAGAVQTVQNGTRPDMECSGRGKCNRSSGLCDCFPGYSRGDCSVQEVSRKPPPTARSAIRRRHPPERKR